MTTWKQQAEYLASNTDKSWRSIAKFLEVPRTTLSDHLRAWKRMQNIPKPEYNPEDVAFRHEALDALVAQAQELNMGYDQDDVAFKEHKNWTDFDVLVAEMEKDTEFKPIMDEQRIVIKEALGIPEYDNSRILLISDMHIPYHHKDSVKWLKELKAKYNPTRIICLGDMEDKHALSYHDSDPDLYSAGHELEVTKKVIAELHEIFPQMDIVDSNHGSLHIRKALTHGIPKAYLKSHNEILGVGDGWKWWNDIILTLPNGQDCYICHGKSANGLKLSQNMAMNVVQGHYHSKFNVQYWSNPRNLFWSLQVGSLIDDKSLAMAYNKLTTDRPIIGTGLIIDSKPILEVMPL